MRVKTMSGRIAHLMGNGRGSQGACPGCAFADPSNLSERHSKDLLESLLRRRCGEISNLFPLFRFLSPNDVPPEKRSW
jgi:hypothetical protein